MKLTLNPQILFAPELLPSPTGGVVADPNMRRSDLDSLHPLTRNAVNLVLARLTAEAIPFRVFEAYRSPQRQAWLYAQGRTRPGAKVTNAQAWQSYHQYGLAVDFVLWLNGTWSWSTAGPHAKYWKRLHELGRAEGLEPLSWELPHLQSAGLSIAKLQAGKIPKGGDDSWVNNLEAAIIGWSGSPAAPPISALRPPIST
jgi:hypothetical protein